MHHFVSEYFTAELHLNVAEEKATGFHTIEILSCHVAAEDLQLCNE